MEKGDDTNPGRPGGEGADFGEGAEVEQQEKTGAAQETGAGVAEGEEGQRVETEGEGAEETGEEVQEASQKAEPVYEEKRGIPWRKIAVIAIILIIAAGVAMFLLSQPAKQPAPVYPMPSLTASNTVVDAGQGVVFNALANGNYTPLSYYFVVTSATTGNTLANVLNYNSLSYNSITYTTKPSDAGNVLYAWVTITYSQGTVNSTRTAAITVNPRVVVANVVAASAGAGKGKAVNLTASWSGGTPTYTLRWYSGPYAVCAQDTSLLSTISNLSSTSESITITPSGTTFYCYTVTDSSNTPVTTLSQPIEVLVGAGGSVSTTSPASASSSPSGATESQQSTVYAISSTLCGLVGSVMTVVGALSLALFLLGGVLYAISHFLPTNLEFKKSMHTWSTTMIVGAIIALVIVLAARPLLTLIVNIGASATGASALAISC